METGKLCNISLHVLHRSLVSFYVNYSLHTPMLICAQLFSSTAFSYYHEYPFTIVTFPAGVNMGWMTYLCFIGFNKGLKFCYSRLSIPAWTIVSLLFQQG